MTRLTPRPVQKKPVQPLPATSVDYRPRDYFGRHDLRATLMTQVKGTVRRRALLEALEEGQINEVPGSVKSAALSDEVRQYVGCLHPSYMGGEYLPTVDKSEVEIARICVKSTTGDVTSVYARLVGHRIAYRVVDEYGGETFSGRAKRTSSKPLTMGQLIDFFLGAWDLYTILDCNFEGDREGMLDFFSGESEFYPYFDSELRRLVCKHFPPSQGALDEN